MRPRARPRWVAVLLTAMLCLALVPSDAWAWTPGTHVFLGDLLLRHLALVPPSLGLLLRRHPDDFLYGSIAADTSIAKKYADVGRHCHHWPVGLEIHDRADTDALKAFALGYLAHLAADVVAHNWFVPRQLAVTSTTAAIPWPAAPSARGNDRRPRCSARRRIAGSSAAWWW